MKTLDQLNAEQAKERAALERQHAVASAMPSAPDFVIFTRGLPPAVTYKVQGVRGALELLRRFDTLVPFCKWRNGWLRLTPLELVPEDMRKTKTEGSYIAHLNVQYHADSHCGAGADAKLKFFARVPGVGVVHVSADVIGPGYIGGYHRLNPGITTQRNAHRKVVARSFDANQTLNGYFDTVVHWGTGDIGPVKSWANMDYLLCADLGDADASPEQCTHAVGQLVNLADELEPVAAESAQ